MEIKERDLIFIDKYISTGLPRKIIENKIIAAPRE